MIVLSTFCGWGGLRGILGDALERGRVMRERSRERKSMTAGELIAALQSLPGDTVVTWASWDSEYDYTAYWSVSGVSEEGVLQSGQIVRSSTGEEEEIAWLRENTPRKAVEDLRKGVVSPEEGETISEAVVRVLANYAFLEDYYIDARSPDDDEISYKSMEVLHAEGVITDREYESLKMARKMLGYDH